MSSKPSSLYHLLAPFGVCSEPMYPQFTAILGKPSFLAPGKINDVTLYTNEDEYFAQWHLNSLPVESVNRLERKKTDIYCLFIK